MIHHIQDTDYHQNKLVCYANRSGRVQTALDQVPVFLVFRGILFVFDRIYCISRIRSTRYRKLDSD